MKYDFETIIDRDPAIRGTGKYRIMKDSKGNKPPKGIVPLSVADMEFRTAPCVIDAIKAEADFGVLGYHRLTDSFRESCCQWMKTRHDWDVQPDWIVPFEQVVPALYNAVWTFTQPGDGILIQTPDYHHFTGATVNTGRKVLENRLVADEKGHYTVDFDDFREKAKQAKLFFLCSPQNPTGRVWTEEELRRMGEICNEYGVMVVADEIHHDLIQPGYKHIVYASLGKEFADNCVVCTSLSKTFNLAGLCYASIIIPNDEVRAKFQKQMGLQAFIKVVDIGQEAVDKLMAEKPWYHTVVIPAGTYDGCDEDITTFAQYTALCARADVPEETVYNLVKTMMENADALEAVHKNAAGTCPERGIEGALIPMHPGAERYYKEVGVLD